MARGTRIVVVGGGYVGMYTALRLQKKLHRGEAEITVIDPQPHMTYQPFLPEAAAGSIEPRHVVVPLRRVLRKCQVLTGRVTSISQERHEITAELAAGHVTTLGYDVLVVAPGSVARTLPIPGLAEQGIAFKTVGEAIYLRNHVLSRLDAAATTIEPALRRGCSPSWSSAAATRASRRWRSWPTWPATPAATTRRSAATTSAGSSSRPPVGSCRRSAPRWGATPSSGCWTPTSRSTSTRASGPWSTAGWSSTTGRRSTPTPSSGRPG